MKEPTDPLAPLLTRRQTLWAMAGVATLPTFATLGCGGGGHGGSTQGVSTSTSATASALPSGFTLPMAQLKGETAFGSAKVAPNGSFAARVRSGGGPTFAWLRHTTTGKYVLFGFAGSGQGGVSAMGSATAILALAFGLGGLPPTAAASLVSLIEADPATATLANVIEARVTADPFALTDGDTQIYAAVQAAVASLGGARGAVAKGVARADPTPILSIQPQDQSGSNVIQKDATDAIIPVNEIRRPAAVYTYQTGYVTADGTATNYPTAVAFGGEQDLAPTTSLLGSLVTLGTRPAFGNVEGSATTLKVYNDTATKTLYETVILMASGKVDGIDADPSFFTDPKYANALAGWKTKRQELNQHAWVGGVLLDLFSSVVGGASTWLSLSTALGAIAEIEALGAEAAALVVKASTGDYLTATLGYLNGISGTNAIASQSYQKIIARVLLRAEGASEAAISAELLTAIGAVAAVVVGTLAAAGTLLGIADVGFSYKDILTSDKADLWTETLLKPSVLISPSTATLNAGASLTLTVGTPGVSETLYKFHWTLSSGGNGNIGDPSGTGVAGHDITTTGNVVNLLTSPSDTDGTVYAITVEALSLASGESLGKATATIKVGAPPPGTGTFAIYDSSGIITSTEFPNGLYNGDILAVVSWTPVANATAYFVDGTGSTNAYGSTKASDGSGYVVSAAELAGQGQIVDPGGANQRTISNAVAIARAVNFAEADHGRFLQAIQLYASWTFQVTENFT